MTPEVLILALVVVTALGFDFTNGFHDTGNAMATSIATGALKPKVAVTLSAILNLVGAFLSVEVAATITKDVLTIQGPTGDLVPGLSPESAMIIIFSGLVGGILWNLLTWLLGLPSSSSHALFGGLIGAGIAGAATVNWAGILGKIIVPALLSPVIAGVVAAVGTWLVYRLTRTVHEKHRETGFRWGQIGTASLVSLAHGTGDAQKTMGVIALALIAHGTLTGDEILSDGLPIWIIRTLGKGLVEIESPQGLAAEAASAAIILTSSSMGMALSTTHVATGSILGSGVGRPGAQVRWGIAGRMVTAWLITMPAAGIVGALCFLVAHLIGGLAGAVTVFVLLIAAATFMYLRSRRQKVDHHNVNAEWDGSPVPQTAAAA